MISVLVKFSCHYIIATWYMRTATSQRPARPDLIQPIHGAAGMGPGRCVSATIDRNVWGTHIAGTFAKATAIGGLSVPVLAFPLLLPASPCFRDPDSWNLNRLCLISFGRARMCACAATTPFGWPSIISSPKAPN